MRIFSLLPSATEIVYALGLGNDLAAVTEECDWPREARRQDRGIEERAAPGPRELAGIDEAVRERMGTREPCTGSSPRPAVSPGSADSASGILRA